MTRIKSTFLAVLVALLSPLAANADFMDQTIEGEWLFPDNTTNYCGTFSAVVGPGVEFPDGDSCILAGTSRSSDKLLNDCR